MVADDVVVVLEVLQHQPVAVLAVARAEPVLDLDRVARPVECGRPAEQGASAAVEEAPDDLVVGVVVGGPGVLVQVEPGVARDPPAERGVARVGEPLEVEHGQPLAVVHPVEHDGEFFVVHSIPGEFHLLGAGEGVLAEVALPRLLVQAEDGIGGPQGMEDRPVGEVLDGVVGPVVAPPALDAFEEAAIVEIAAEERLAGPGVGPQQLALQDGPGGRLHRRRHAEMDGLGGVRPGHRHRQE